MSGQGRDSFHRIPYTGVPGAGNLRAILESMRHVGGREHGWCTVSRFTMRVTLGAVVAVATVPTVALADRAAKVVGNPKAGKPIFVSTCAVCHTLKAAGALGKIGPNLDRTRLSQAVSSKRSPTGAPR